MVRDGHRKSWILGIGLSLLLLAGWGGGVTTITAATTPPPAVAVALGSAPSSLTVSVSITSPATDSTSLTAGGTLGITASVTGTGNTALTWTVSGAQAGTVTNGSATIGTITGGTADSVKYNAPAALPGLNNPVTITATSKADPTKSASIMVTIIPSSTTPNAINVPGGTGTNVSAINLSISSLAPALQLVDIGTCTTNPMTMITSCSAGVAAVQISRSSGTPVTMYALGNGLTTGGGAALAPGLNFSVSHGSGTIDAPVSGLTPAGDNAGLNAVEFTVTVSPTAALGPRNVYVTNAAGELQSFVGGIEIVP